MVPDVMLTVPGPFTVISAVLLPFLKAEPIVNVSLLAAVLSVTPVLAAVPIDGKFVLAKLAVPVPRSVAPLFSVRPPPWAVAVPPAAGSVAFTWFRAMVEFLMVAAP